MKPNILLTGSTGFLGSVLRQELATAGYPVTGLEEVSGTRIDITKPFRLSGPFDWVIHCAGKAHFTPRTAEEEKMFYEVNYEGTKNLCDALLHLARPPVVFIFLSTVAVYGIDEGTGISEQYPLHGATPYAKSKIQAESYLRKWAEQNQVTLGILRLPLIAGPHPKGNLGAMIKGIRSGRYLGIGKGAARKSMVWAGDIARIIPQLAAVGGTYHVTDGYHPSFSELEQAIAAQLHKRPPRRMSMKFARLLGKIGDCLGAASPVNSAKIQKMATTLTFDDKQARLNLGWQPTPVLDKIDIIV